MFKRLLLIAIVAVAGSASFAGAAHAAVIDNDSVQLLSNKVDFGDNTFVAGHRPAPATSHGLQPRNRQSEATGTLHLRNAAGLCARMRLEQFSRAGVLLVTTVGGTVCAANNAHQTFAVNLNAAGNALTYTPVSIERTNAGGGWLDRRLRLGDGEHARRRGRDRAGRRRRLRGPGWLFGAPVGSGSVSWNLENGSLKPHLRGTLHLVNNAGTCARMNINYLTDAGVFITSMPGGTVCAPNNGAFAWTVDLAPYRDVLGQVQIELQTLNAGRLGDHRRPGRCRRAVSMRCRPRNVRPATSSGSRR